MRAPADGYTLMYNDNGHWAINPALFKTLPYDTLRDLAPVGLFAQSTLFLVATASFPANNLQELVAAVKAKPDAYNYASSGVGSPHHLSMEDFKSALGLKVLHVPYKGSALSVPALVGGEVQMAIASLPAVQGFVKDGRLKLIAANSRARSAFENSPWLRMGLSSCWRAALAGSKPCSLNHFLRMSLRSVALATDSSCRSFFPSLGVGQRTSSRSLSTPARWFIANALEDSFASAGSPPYKLGITKYEASWW